MKVLMINGSPRKGCTYTALSEIAKILEAEGIESEIVSIGTDTIRGCIGCRRCADGNGCVFGEDGVNATVEKIRAADALIVGSPVYYASANGSLISFLDRVFYSGARYFAGKPAAAIASARRAGTTATLDELNKYFLIAKMPVVASSYWNMVHGSAPEDVLKDAEGMQTMRNLGRNMAWLLRCIEAGKAAGIHFPENESGTRTNFIR